MNPAPSPGGEFINKRRLSLHPRDPSPPISSLNMSVAHQPLDPEVIPRLDPDYVKFHEEVLQYIVPPHTLPWSPEIRNAPAVPGSSAVLDCDIKDYPLSHTSVRSFTPKGTPPTEGWPVFLFYHGGKWCALSIDYD